MLGCTCSDDGDKMDEPTNDEDPATPAAVNSTTDVTPPSDDASSATKQLPFPSSSDLNTRLRRIISTYQKMSRKKAEAAAAAKERVCSSLAIYGSVCHMCLF